MIPTNKWATANVIGAVVYRDKHSLTVIPYSDAKKFMERVKVFDGLAKPSERDRDTHCTGDYRISKKPSEIIYGDAATVTAAVRTMIPGDGEDLCHMVDSQEYITVENQYVHVKTWNKDSDPVYIGPPDLEHVLELARKYKSIKISEEGGRAKAICEQIRSFPTEDGHYEHDGHWYSVYHYEGNEGHVTYFPNFVKNQKAAKRRQKLKVKHGNITANVVEHVLMAQRDIIEAHVGASSGRISISRWGRKLLKEELLEYVPKMGAVVKRLGNANSVKGGNDSREHDFPKCLQYYKKTLAEANQFVPGMLKKEDQKTFAEFIRREYARVSRNKLSKEPPKEEKKDAQAA